MQVLAQIIFGGIRVCSPPALALQAGEVAFFSLGITKTSSAIKPPQSP
jgi:hypothetical protein